MFFILKLFSRLPLRLLYFIASLLKFPLQVIYRRKLVVKNLKMIFKNHSEDQINQIVKDFYKGFCDVVVEILKATTISEKEISRRVRFVNPEIIFQAKEKSESILFYASHQCNWEWMALASGANLTVPGDVIYKPLQNENADQFIYTMRSRFGGKPISKDKAAREILRLKGKHRIIGLVADQSPPREHVHWAHFLGVETDFYPGLVQLPYLMQAPAVFGRITKAKRGFYEVELIKIGEPPYEKDDFSVLQNYIRETERLIEDHPEDYLWTHNRWKHTREENEEIINFPSSHK
ncbi:MAG: lysophospholipid acyltransferase family protein [Bacteroidota bacterium]